MIRALWFLFLLGVLAATSMWLADNPGHMTLVWQGYEIETSAAVLTATFVGFGVITALVYRIWIFVRGVPAGLFRMRRDSRSRRGYVALTRGMVAVAAGDAKEAERQGRRANGLLDDPPLTMLLSAQAAQLSGDGKAAEKFFTEMLERPETEFLGLRGLLNQAVKAGDGPAALKWVRRAYRLQPKSEWVVRTLFDLASRSGHWSEASEALSGAVHGKLLEDKHVKRHRAVLGHQLSMEAEEAGDPAKALSLAKKAQADAPAFVPAATHYAGLLIEQGKPKKAIAVIEAAWREDPHPDLADVYWRASDAADPIKKMKAAQKLASFKAANNETLMMLAKVAIDAGLWGDARKNMMTLGDQGPVSIGYCRLMAKLEEGENINKAAAHEWLVRAADAEPDSAWVCDGCGNRAVGWTALCGKCGGFDSFSWRCPPRVPGITAIADRSAGDMDLLAAPVKAGQEIDGESPPQ